MALFSSLNNEARQRSSISMESWKWRVGNSVMIEHRYRVFLVPLTLSIQTLLQLTMYVKPYLYNNNREEKYKRKLQRSNNKSEDSEKPCNNTSTSTQDKGLKIKLKLALIIIVSSTFLTIFIRFRPNLMRRWGNSDPRYRSNLKISWDDISKVLDNLNQKEYQTIGLLNFNKDEVEKWNQQIPDAQQTILTLETASENITWETLYPEWIDEEEEENIPICPTLPKLKPPPKKRLDLIAVKLPCRVKAVKNWSRDVGRLHLQLATARLASVTKGNNYPVHLVFITDCFPIPNLFSCKELVKHEGNVWLYKPNLDVLRRKVRLPVGSCELALPLKHKEKINKGNPRREAYATILHSAHVYVCGAIAAAQSIQMAGSTRDLVILVDETISAYHKSGLESAGWKIRTIQRIRNPKAEKDAYNEFNYSKFRLWQLTDYDKIIFIDSDLLILRNIDFLFNMPEISATGNDATLFNSGVMLIEPSNCTFNLLMKHINEIESNNGGDQGYLNEIFTWWHRIPRKMNFLKHFWVGDEENKKQIKTRLFGSDPPVLYMLHYLGIKPWLCHKDYDCNWNTDFLQEFASDVAHERWWKVHDKMPENLQRFCLLRSKQKAQIEWDRRQAEKGNYSDGHWKIRVEDKRMKVCIDKVCNWKGMLKHWGETNSNWTDDDELFTPSPPAITV